MPTKKKTDGAPTLAALMALPPATLATLLAGVVASVQEAQGQLPAAMLLGKKERLTSIGKIGDDELDEQEAILDTVDAAPHIFAALAPHDGGADPAVVETGPARHAIALLRALGPLTAAVSTLDDTLSDMRLRLGTQVREMTVPARAIAKSNASLDGKVRSGLAKVEQLRSARVNTPTKKPAKPTG